MFLSASEIGIGLLLPSLILNRKANERQKQIRNSLPDILDLLTVSVEAGLGFDGALAKVGDKMPGQWLFRMSSSNQLGTSHTAVFL
jgi:tight adherence protein C